MSYNCIYVNTITIFEFYVNLQAVILWPNCFVTWKLQTGQTRLLKVMQMLRNITQEQHF